MSEEFEQALRRALRRENPGEEFAGRVVAQLDSSTREQPRVVGLHARRSRLLHSRWLPAALAACVIAGVGLFQLRQHSLEAERANQARAQLLQALSIASDNVNIVRAAVTREENPTPAVPRADRPSPNLPLGDS
jgi:acyl-CoA synthetase (AMP-forming)/AMP-acid ligase II